VSSAKICPTCGASYPADEKFCPKDGSALRNRDSAANDLVGSVVAERYHVLRKLGEGGMGQVYLAEHVKMKRQSAVKVMSRAAALDADAIARFNREAATASKIDHPNVASIYDFGETDDGLVYLAMQYVEGETLTNVLRAEGALQPLRAAEIIRQAADGLHAAHVLGIVHRDLKPDNIMLTKDRDGLDSVKVVDFGIAKAVDGAAEKMTRTGTVVGTPDYMSPEQLSGDAVDGRSDTYSLAIVAFNLLTGRLPFPATSTQTAMIMRLTDKPKSLSEMNPAVRWPAEVQAVMDRALERDADLRYDSTRDFGRALYAAVVIMPPVSGVTEIPLGAEAPRQVTKVLAEPTAGSRAGKRWPLLPYTFGAMIASLALLALLLFSRPTPDRQGGPNDPRPHIRLARAARDLNDLTTANREAMLAVQLAPNNGPALRELASVLFAQQSYAGARAFYTRAIKANPNDHLSQGFLGCTLIRLGRVDEGKRWIERAGTGAWSSCVPPAVAPDGR
jgi:tRNA A-37 threonylcarbamoyl transferase component Bud32